MTAERWGSIHVDPNPVFSSDVNEPAAVTVSWRAGGCDEVVVRVGSADGPVFAKSSGEGTRMTGPWVNHGERFYLQDASSGASDSADNTLAVVTVVVLPTALRIPELGTEHVAESPNAAVLPPPPRGQVNFGDLRRLQPIGTDWGFDRGVPIDRYFIEEHLRRHASDIKGRVLEFGNPRYTRQFGGANVGKSDVMNVQGGIDGTTIRTDLTACVDVADSSFDCIICTQVLQFIHDLAAAVRQLHRILAPGGVLLLTTPGISCCYEPDWGDHWSWNLTPTSVRRLFADQFGAECVEITAFGNLVTAVAFLHGLAADELQQHELETRTLGYEIVVAARIIKPHQGNAN